MAGLNPATPAVRRSDREVEGSNTVSTLAVVAIVRNSRNKTT
jgi:hypothetical protein